MPEGAGLGALFALPGVDAPPGLNAARIRLLHPAALAGTEWILASRSAHLFRVFHEDYELCVVPPEGNARDAGGDYTYRRWSLDCRPGQVYLLEPDTLHANHRIYAAADFFVVKVPRALVAQVGDELGFGPRPHFRLAATHAPPVHSAIDALVAALATGAEPLAQQALLVRALRTVLAACAERSERLPSDASAGALSRAREYLHAHARRSVTLDDLARVSGLDRFHLLRSFARAYGLPPHAYLTQLRVSQARRQLAAGTPPSAVDVGFFDQAHLTRHFRRAYALTPAAYQRAISS